MHNEVDYILIDKHNIVKNVDILHQVNIGSDHKIIQINTKRERRKLFFSRPEYIKIHEAYISAFQVKV